MLKFCKFDIGSIITRSFNLVPCFKRALRYASIIFIVSILLILAYVCWNGVGPICGRKDGAVIPVLLSWIYAVVCLGIYSSAFSLSVLMGRRWARMLYFVFPLVLVLEEVLNFGLIMRTYIPYQLAFATLLAVWFWCLDVLLGELIARKFPRLAAIPTLLLGFILFIFPVTTIANWLINGSSICGDSLQAVYQTDFSEAITYLYEHPIGWFLGIFILVSVVGIYFLNRVGERRPASKHVLIATGVALLVLMPLIWTDYTHVWRNNFTCQVFVESLEYFHLSDAYKADADKRLAIMKEKIDSSSGDDGIYVLIVGESHNRNRCSAYGYHLDTTPFLRQVATDPDCIRLEHPYSCAVMTLKVLSMLLTSWNQYDALKESVHLSIIDIAKYCSYDTVYLNNQATIGNMDSRISLLISDVDKMINIAPQTNYSVILPDGKLLESLPDLLQADRRLVVIRMMGNHQMYSMRYPKDFHPELNWHPYDKSVLYTDFILKNMIEMFRANPRVKAAIYVPDHSETVDLGHGSDFYRPEMCEIPMLVYLSAGLRKARPDLNETLRKNASQTFTNDLVFELMLDLMNIRHDLSPSYLSIAKPEYAMTKESARTLWGTLPVETPKPKSSRP